MKSLLVKKDLNILLATKMLKNKPWCIFLPKMTGYRKDFNETKFVFFEKR